jgi:hypothetical protein
MASSNFERPFAVATSKLIGEIGIICLAKTVGDRTNKRRIIFIQAY